MPIASTASPTATSVAPWYAEAGRRLAAARCDFGATVATAVLPAAGSKMKHESVARTCQARLAAHTATPRPSRRTRRRVLCRAPVWQNVDWSAIGEAPTNRAMERPPEHRLYCASAQFGDSYM